LNSANDTHFVRNLTAIEPQKEQKARILRKRTETCEARGEAGTVTKSRLGKVGIWLGADLEVGPATPLPRSPVKVVRATQGLTLRSWSAPPTGDRGRSEAAPRPYVPSDGSALSTDWGHQLTVARGVGQMYDSKREELHERRSFRVLPL